MLKTNTKLIAKLFNTQCLSTDFCGVSIDSRDCKDKLFIAIIGERFDGHDFIDDAIHNGAKAVVVSKHIDCDIPTILVKDTIRALGNIAQFHKRQINPKIIAITGSNGKTTTKNMLYNIFSQIAPTLKTAGNFNNHIGVPLTLLNLETRHKYAIIELGANHLGEIGYLRDLIHPDVACVINTLDAHIGEFGGKENLIRAKSEIFHTDSINIINSNTPITRPELKYMRFGGDYSLMKNITLQLLGKHNEENALASIAVAKSLGVSEEIIKKGLENTNAESGRMQIVKRENYTIINDCYNASPSSTTFALQTLEKFTGIKIAILGNMAELGDKSSEIHAKIGKYAKSLDIDYLYSVGDIAKNYNFTHFNTFDSLIDVVRQHKNATILLKASRSAKFENILKKLT